MGSLLYETLSKRFEVTFEKVIFVPLEVIFGTKLVITGDQEIEIKDCPLIIMNHRCRLDWMFYWMALLRYGRLHNEKIIMKYELKMLPGPGWCMQNSMYFFLRRKWDQDQSYLDRILNYLIDLKYPLQLFLFPEGTDLCKESKERSALYAAKNGLVKYEYCLHPRVKGFNYLVQKLRNNILDTLHDVTVGYPVNLCYGEKDIATGNFPKEIHLYIQRYALTDLPTDSEELDQWCIDRWAEKESRLKKFYEERKFPGRPIVSDIVTQRANAVMYFALAFWTLFLYVAFSALWCYSLVRWYALVMIVFYVVQTMRGGTDTLQLDIHEREKQKMN